MNVLLCLLSILLTIVCWGVYGPLLHWGQEAMGEGRMRPFICVGIAYFLIAVLAPMILLSLGIEREGHWSFRGSVWSLAAGGVGALGALGIILAFTFQGKPIFVMPLVFGGAPVINTLLTVSVNRQWGNVSPIFYAGLLLVGVGAVTVLISQPRHAKPATTRPASAASKAPATSSETPPSAATQEAGGPSDAEPTSGQQMAQADPAASNAADGSDPTAS